MKWIMYLGMALVLSACGPSWSYSGDGTMSVRKGINGLIPYRVLKFRSDQFDLNGQTKFTMNLGVLADHMKEAVLYIEVPEKVVDDHHLPQGRVRLLVEGDGHNLLELNEEIKDMRYAHPLDDVERTYGIYSETKPSFKVPPGSALKVQMEFFPHPGEEEAKKATVYLTVLFSEGGK